MELYELFFRFFVTSVIGSALVAILCGLDSFWNKIYSARVKKVVWILLMLYFIVPLNLPRTEPLMEVKLSGEDEIVFHNTVSEKELVLFRAEEPEQAGTVETSKNIVQDQSIVSGREFSVWQSITIVWLAGCVISLGYEVLQYLLYRKYVLRWGKNVKSETVDILLKEIAEEYKISGKIPVRVTEKINSPMLLGFFKPCILLPHIDFGKSELETIIRHELLHYRKNDLWCKVLFTIAKSVHWFNPLVHVMCKYANADLERACDDCALKGKSFEQRKEYAETILATVKQQKGNSWSSCFYGGKAMLKERFENILNMKKKRNGSILFVIMLVLFVGVNSLVACNLSPESQVEEQTEYDEEALEFSKKFVNEFQGTIAKETNIELEEYITNENLLTFAEKMIVVTQKQIAAGGSMIHYGADNEFYEVECNVIQEDVLYVNLLFDYEGSGLRCQLLVNTREKMEILDFYFGSMDGVDTISTGHISQRTVDNPTLWEDEQWVLSVFEKLTEYEGMLDAMGAE